MEKQTITRALTRLYRRVLADLAETEPQALRALELLVFLHDGSYIPSAFIVLSLGDALGLASANDSHLRAITQRALATLKDRYLINVRKNTYLVIPQLAKTIISQLIHHRGQELHQHLRAGILRFITMTRSELPDMPLKEFIDNHRLTMIHLATTYIDPQKTGGPLQYMGIYSEALSACMSAIGEDLWRAALVMFQTSEGSFSLMVVSIPKEADSISRLQFYISWNDPESHQIEWVVDGWDKRKARLAFVVDRSGGLFTTPEAGHVLAGQGACRMIIGQVANKPPGEQAAVAKQSPID